MTADALRRMAWSASTKQAAHHLTQALTDPENQPNQYGVEFGMSGQKMHFKIGNQLFMLAYEPDDQQEFEFMKRMLIRAFSTFTPDVKAAPQPSPVAQGDAQPMQPSDDDVICPSCSHQFRAIPVNVQKLMLDAGIAPPFTSSAQKDVAMDTFQKNGIAWAVDRWKSEVMNRPMRNLHRRSLDDAWRQVVRYFGGCPDTLLGPCHDASRAQAEEGGAS